MRLALTEVTTADPSSGTIPCGDLIEQLTFTRIPRCVSRVSADLFYHCAATCERDCC